MQVSCTHLLTRTYTHTHSSIVREREREIKQTHKRLFGTVVKQLTSSNAAAASDSLTLAVLREPDTGGVENSVPAQSVAS